MQPKIDIETLVSCMEAISDPHTENQAREDFSNALLETLQLLEAEKARPALRSIIKTTLVECGIDLQQRDDAKLSPNET